MKHVLYIILGLLLNTIRTQSEDYYDLLYEFQDALSLSGSEMTINEETSSNSVKLDKLTFSNATLSSPFIVNVEFRIDKYNQSCLFSIEDNSGIKVALCLTPAAPTISRVSLFLESNKDKKIGKYEITIGKWTKLLIYVKHDKVSVYIDCYQINDIDFSDPITDISLPSGADLFIGRSLKHTPPLETFEGAVKELKIYYNVTDLTVENSICKEDDFKFPSSLDDDNGDVDFTDSEPGEKGEKGEKGDKGIKGEAGSFSKGPQGPQGPIGHQGLPGLKGEEGACKCSESVVSSLLKTMPEMRGPPGDTGPMGDTGDPGSTGMTGKPGEKGERGVQGLKGETGERGEDGSPGRDGLPGGKGDPGENGLPGTIGPQGTQGPPGPPGPTPKDIEVSKEVTIPGPQGEQGPIGPPGVPGSQGIPGIKGEKGHEGLKGQKGERGKTGIDGPKGDTGDRGESGLDGLPGTPGTHGRHGEKGDKGDIGIKGDNGLPGMPAKLSSILTSSPDDEENARIVELLRGIKGDRGSDGEKGDTGAEGPVGAPGTPGKDGRHGNHGAKGEVGPQGEEGPSGTKGLKGDRGERGPPGLPANVTAIALKGIEGPQGPPGDTGPPGDVGPKGSKGATGSTGPKGVRGHTGHPGDTGPIGPSGKNGAKGEKGDSPPPIDLKNLKGEKGDRGSTGPVGDPGPSGLPGSNATCLQCQKEAVMGPAGAPGPPGPPGPPGSSLVGPKGEPGGIVSQKTLYTYTEGSKNSYFEDDDDFYTASTVIYKSTTALFKRTTITPLGTLAYVLQEKVLLLRIERGWQHVTMGSIFDNLDNNVVHLPSIPQPHYPTTTHKYLNPVLPFDAHSKTTSYSGNYMVSPTEPSIKKGSRKNSIRVAALNEPYSGKMFFSPNRFGWKAANYECHRQSRTAGGTFTAFLTMDIKTLRYIVAERHQHLPVRNLKEQLLFHSWASMFNQSGAPFAVPNAFIFSFDGKNVMKDLTWPEKVVWHGGTLEGGVTADGICNKWESDSPNEYGIASPLHTNHLLAQARYPCDRKLIVLCIEVKSTRSTSSPVRRRHVRSKTLRQRSGHDQNSYSSRKPGS